MAQCQLELMGLHDAAAYRRLCQNTLKAARPVLSGLNVPNKKPGESLLERAAVLRQELPDIPVCVHYSLKHQRARGDPVALFQQFCSEAESLGVQRILLVTGPSGPRIDAVAILEKLKGMHPAHGRLRLGVAFNACLPTETERVVERERLVRKLKTGLVEDVWLNCGSDTDLLEEGISFIRAASEGLPGVGPLTLFGSVLRPNEAQLLQMRERPWNGVHFHEDYLGSLAGMDRLTRAVLALYASLGVQPIVESKVRNREDVAQLESMLSDTSLTKQASSQLDSASRVQSGTRHKNVMTNGERDDDHDQTPVLGDVSRTGEASDKRRWLRAAQEKGSANVASFYPAPRQTRRWTPKAQ